MQQGTPQLCYLASLQQLADAFACWRWQHVYITHPIHGFMGAVPTHDFLRLQQQGVSLDGMIPYAMGGKISAVL